MAFIISPQNGHSFVFFELIAGIWFSALESSNSYTVMYIIIGICASIALEKGSGGRYWAFFGVYAFFCKRFGLVYVYNCVVGK